MYALLGLASTLSMGTFAALLEDGRRRRQLAYALSTTLMLYTHAYSVFVVAAQVMVLALARAWYRDAFNRVWRPWLVAAGGIFLLYTPWLATLADQVVRVQSAFWIDRPSWSAILDPFVAYAGSTPLLAISGGLGLMGLLSAPVRSRSRSLGVSPALLLAPWLVIPVLAPLVLSRLSAPIFLAKYTIAASTPFAVLIACGVMAVPRRAWRVPVLLLMAALLVPVFKTYFGTPHKDGWRRAAARLESAAEPGDFVVFYPWYNQVPYDYYRERDDLVRQPLIPDIHTLIPLSSDVPGLVARVSNQPRLWFVVLQGTPQRDRIVNELSGAMRLTEHSVAEHVELFLFQRRR